MLHEGVVLVDYNNVLDNTKNENQQLDTKIKYV